MGYSDVGLDRYWCGLCQCRFVERKNIELLGTVGLSGGEALVLFRLSRRSGGASQSDGARSGVSLVLAFRDTMSVVCYTAIMVSVGVADGCGKQIERCVGGDGRYYLLVRRSEVWTVRLCWC